MQPSCAIVQQEWSERTPHVAGAVDKKAWYSTSPPESSSKASAVTKPKSSPPASWKLMKLIQARFGTASPCAHALQSRTARAWSLFWLACHPCSLAARILWGAFCRV